MKPLTIILIVLSMNIAVAEIRAGAQQEKKNRSRQVATGRTSHPEVKISNNQELSDLAESLDYEEVLNQRANRPIFSIKDGVFTYYQGDVPKMGDDLSGPRQHPILVPIARAFQLKELRQLIADQPETDMQFWTPYFEEAYRMIEDKMLPMISGGASTEDIFTQVKSVDEQIAVIFRDTAPKAFAEARQLNFKRPGIIQLGGLKFSVSFALSPNDGQVSVIPSTYFRPDGKFDFMWRELEQNPKLIGRYHYKVRWPDGTIRGPAAILIDQPGQVFPVHK